MMKKKGEITTQQLVLIIILIVSFAVILFLLFRLNLGETSSKEICQNSVVLQSKTKGFVGALNCRTNYLCISGGGGGCEGISASQTVTVNPKDKAEIMGAIANEMADCWRIFGEGEIDYSGESFLKSNVVCAVCSIVEFDEKIQEEQESGTNYKEFLDYLSNSKRGEETYLQYLFDVFTIDELTDKFDSIKSDYDGSNPISLKEQYMIRTGQINKAVILRADLVGKIIKFVAGDDKSIYNIFPYFFNINEIPEPQCDEFVTKS